MKTEEQKKRDRERQREKYAIEHHIREYRICVICGKEFISKSEKTQTCSKKCGDLLSRKKHGVCNTELLTKTCAICGKQFTTYKSRKTTCSDNCSKSLKVKRDHERHHGIEDRVKVVKENVPDGWLFVGLEKKQTSGKVKLQCVKCGEIIAVGLYKNYDNLLCPGCVKKDSEESSKRKQIRETRAIQYKALQNAFLELHPGQSPSYYQEHICKSCGKAFMARHPNKQYCSKPCQRKAERERCGSRRRYKDRFTADKYIDKDITVKKVVMMNMGICQICGRPINYDDYEIIEGAFITGPDYPSVDHIIPRAKGGEHSWSNVQLAHFRCNTIKRDTTV